MLCLAGSALDEHAPRRPKFEDKEREREQVEAKEVLEENQFRWDASVLKTCLPLMPEQSVHIPLALLGHVGWYDSVTCVVLGLISGISHDR
jgi:hypothetical protein